MTKEALTLAAEMERGQFSTTLLPAAAELRRLHEENRKLRAQEALNKKAENARELGLDYEPERLAELGWQEIDCPICGGGARAFPKPEQEPVAWMHTKIEGVAVPHRPADLDKHPDRWTPLYKDPKPCPTCEALARTVMLDQTSHDTTPPQPEQEPVAWRYKWSVEGGNWVWNYATYIERQKNDQCEPLYTSPPQRKPLTDEEIWEALGGIDCTRPMLIARAIEAAHGIKD